MSLKIIPFAKPRLLRLSRAYGQYVWDEVGRRYLDCHTGHGVAFLGHRNPKVVESIKRQMELIMTATPAFQTDIADEALSKLSKILPSDMDYVFFLNSGSEAVELAMKIARKVTGRKRFIAFRNSFHGRTMGALSVTWNPKYREGYDPFPWETRFVPYNDVDAITSEVDESVAAVLFEPVQGEGGLTPATQEFAKALMEACEKAGAFLIVDEVQAGFGRTGKIWAHEHLNIRPDIMVAGKSIGGGFPVSVVVVKTSIGERLREGEHGSTHGGNPLALAAISGGIDALIGDSVPLKASLSGEKLSTELKKVVECCAHVARGVKGKGLMLGIELRFPPDEVIRELQMKGLLCLKAGTSVLRLLPPYLITDEDIKFCSETIKEVLSAWKHEREVPKHDVC
ncbi:MAG: aspartate aminotransferase family protein [Thaumarchaeota archaeon]|jgi:acetylornithine/LysW-gamma-L-lysine aminotransferase|nr:aspartate aminotransferase family protein [Candidatus Terraquivivens yellowstonensis]MCL7392319.1 aspartate aminotransferase family protein [Candidatus Terraquivivens yellowstonensis]MCL7399008.1 aspartate aminotransferase family protein [Candidatus Terraquivivens yellowstonensis]MCL7400492.1 aspartate aminotransferase family protein [Candidatus Terraquivivens yellowstonensis]